MTPTLAMAGVAGILMVVLLAALALMIVSKVNSAHVPAPLDTSLALTTGSPWTASAYSTGLDLGAGFAPGGIGMPMAIVTNISGLDATTGNETYVLQMEESADNITFTDAGPTVTVTATGIVSVPGIVSKRYVRLDGTLGGNTPILTFTAHVTPQGFSGA